MKVVDANVLLYAVDEDAPRHEGARIWLDGALSGGATVGFAWIVLLAFLRLSTKKGLFAHPLSASDALARVDEWLAQPSAVVIEPTARHLEVMMSLVSAVGQGGNLFNDAHLAALSVEHRGQVVTYDTDFGRFPGVRSEIPGG